MFMAVIHIYSRSDSLCTTMDTKLMFYFCSLLFCAATLTQIRAVNVEAKSNIEDTETAGNCDFSVGPLHSLYGHKDESLGRKNLQQCLEACALNVACMSVTHNFENNNCFLSHSSRETDPGDYRRHPKKNYYQKETCDSGDGSSGSGEGLCIKTVGPFGGTGGMSFSDEQLFNLHQGSISKIQINHGYSIDCIKVTYGRKEEAIKGPCHGGTGGVKQIIKLKKNEYITRIDGYTGLVIDRLKIITNLKTYGYYGREGDESFSATGDGRLAYISGRAGDLLDQLYFHFHC